MKTKIHFLLIAAILSGFVLVPSCTKDKTPTPPEPCDPNKVYYERDIKPLVISKCAMSGCHDAATAQEGYNLTTYNGLLRMVKKGNPGGSEIIKVISASRDKDRMPPSPYTALTATQVALISRWITEGAPNNSCVDDSTSCVYTSVSYSATIKPLVDDKCGSCHGNSKQSGGYNFSTFPGLKAAVSNGKLYNSVAQNGQALNMPEGGKLQACEIKAIKVWVDAGAPEN